MHTMLIRPTHAELDAFGAPDFVICNAGAFPANRLTTGMGSTTSIDLSLEDKELVILGTEYAGEIEKGGFYRGKLLRAETRRALDALLGDGGQGKRPFVAAFRPQRHGQNYPFRRSKRHLIGDDEHCWSDEGIFNIEGGCYAKAINLTPENEPDIFEALRFGAVLENVVLDDDQHVDFKDTSITENTRGAYPIEFIQNAKIPCIAGHPTDVIF
jgi:phosphoenolpyruvate carboxykinase (ATP)